MKNIKKIVLGNKINSTVFSLGKEIYIVGGYLRDILIGKKNQGTLIMLSEET